MGGGDIGNLVPFAALFVGGSDLGDLKGDKEVITLRWRLAARGGSGGGLFSVPRVE